MQKTAVSRNRAAKCAAVSTGDSDLAFVVERWLLLSDSVRNEICRLAAGE
jgi:hypothetical protein